MLDTLAVVPVAGASARRLWYPVAGVPVLEWVLRRLGEAQQLDLLVVLTGPLEQEAPVLGLIPPDVTVYRSARADLLARLDGLLARYPCRGLVLVPPDAPFVDPVLVDRLVTQAREHPECDYLGFATAEGKPLFPEQVGLFGQWVRAQVLRHLHRRLTASQDRCQPLRYLLAHSGVYCLRLLALPESLLHVRLRMQGAQDWEHLEAIYEALGPDRLHWKNILELIQNQPELREQMVLLNRQAQQEGT